MNFQKYYSKFSGLLFLGVLTTAVSAQKVEQKPTVVTSSVQKEITVAAGNNLYCAGYVQSLPVNTASKIVGAEDEREQKIYAEGDNLYINAGESQGVKVGDMFSVIRPHGRVDTRLSNKKNLGFYVQEVGALEVIEVKPNVSVARVKNSCDNLLLGDLLQPVQQKTSPQFRERPALDVFAGASGKASGRIFLARGERELLGREQIVYIDLGAEDRVNVGDYLTVFRPLGKSGFFEKDDRGDFHDVSFPERDKETRRGLRKVVGEIVILDVKERTATAMITRTAQEIHRGDWVELQ